MSRYTKFIIEIEENRLTTFIEHIKSFDYVKSFSVMEKEETSNSLLELIEAFNDAKLHQQGKKELKSAKDLFKEL